MRDLTGEPRLRGWWASLAVVAVFAILHQAYIGRAHPDAVFLDTPRYLVQLQEWLAGRMSFIDYWHQGQHRGFIFQSLLLANVRWFQLDPLLATRLSGLAIALTAALVSGTMLLRSADTPHGRRVAGVAALLATALLFSWAGFEILTWDLGLALWIKNACFVLLFLAQERVLRAAKLPFAIATSLGMAIVVLYAAMGWSYAFVASVLAVQLLAAFDQRRDAAPSRRHLPVLAALLAQACAIMLAGGALDQPQDASATTHVRLDGILLLPYGLGSAIAGSEAMGHLSAGMHILWAMGFVSIVLGIVLAWRRFARGVMSGPLLPLYLLAYGGACAASFAMARSDLGPAGAMASRYSMDLVAYTIGVLWLLGEEAARPGPRTRAWSGVFAGFALLVLAGQAYTYLREWKVAPYRAQSFREINRVTRAIPATEADAAVLQSVLVFARPSALVMQAQGLGPFRGQAVRAACSQNGIRSGTGWFADAGGDWMGAKATLELPSCACSYETTVYIPENYPRRILSLSYGGTRTRLLLAPGAVTPLRLPPNAPKVVIEADATTIPSRDFPGSADVRALGALFGPGNFKCASAPALPAP